MPRGLNRIGDLRLGDEFQKKLAQKGEVLVADSSIGRNSPANLKRCIYEGAPRKLRRTAPLFERIKEGENTPPGVRAESQDFRGDPRSPSIMATFEPSLDEVFLRVEVMVKCHLGDARTLEDRLDTDRL